MLFMCRRRKLARISPNRKILGNCEGQAPENSEGLQKWQGFEKEWMKVCKKGSTSVEQNLMGNVKSKVRVFSLGEDIE